MIPRPLNVSTKSWDPSMWVTKSWDGAGTPQCTGKDPSMWVWGAIKFCATQWRSDWSGWSGLTRRVVNWTLVETKLSTQFFCCSASTTPSFSSSDRQVAVHAVLTCFKKHSITASGSSCQLQLSRAGRNRLANSSDKSHVPNTYYRNILFVKCRYLWQGGENRVQVISQFLRYILRGSRLDVQEIVLGKMIVVAHITVMQFSSKDSMCNVMSGLVPHFLLPWEKLGAVCAQRGCGQPNFAR